MFFSFLLEVGTHSTSVPRQVSPLSICSPKRWIHECGAAVLNRSHCLVCSKTWGKGLAEVQACKPAGAGVLQGELLHCWGGWFLPLLRQLELGRQLCIGLVTCLQRGERALASLVIKGWWRRGRYADISAVPTDVLCKSSCDVVRTVGDVLRSFIYLHWSVFVWQISSISHVSPMWVKMLASLQTQWARMCCKPLSK